MFSLLYGFYEYFFQKPSYKILIIGVDNAGKTVSVSPSSTLSCSSQLILNYHNLCVDSIGAAEVHQQPEIDASEQDPAHHRAQPCAVRQAAG